MEATKNIKRNYFFKKNKAKFMAKAKRKEQCLSRFL